MKYIPLLIFCFCYPFSAPGNDAAVSGSQKAAGQPTLFEENNPALPGRTHAIARMSDGTVKQSTSPVRIQTIRGGDVSMKFALGGSPLSFARGNGVNLINTADPGPGFYLTTGSETDEKTIPIIFMESKDGKLLATAADGTRITLLVNAGKTHVSFSLEEMENVPDHTEPILRFRVNFKNVCPELVPFDYMCTTSGKWASIRCFCTASWPFLWRRAESDPLGGFALFVPSGDDDHNEAVLRVWTEENVPHPRVNGQWNYERATQWVQEWREKFEHCSTLGVSAEKPEDLDLLFEHAKKLSVNRLYLHTDTWRGAYWVYDRDPLSVNSAVFPRGEADLKAFQDKLKANHMDAMLHTICYGVGQEGSKYIGKGKKTDRRLANWGRGTLEKSISATETTLLFRPAPGVRFPAPKTYAEYWRLDEILVDDEILPCKFENIDQPVWTLIAGRRGVAAADHEAGAEVVGLLKAYGQNYYPSSMTDLSEITAREYAEFFNRLGVDHHEHDGAECHNDVPWGYSKWAMFVYQNTDHPVTSNNSGGALSPWDLVYRMKFGGVPIGDRGAGGSAALAVHRDGRLATSPIENHFTLAPGAVENSQRFHFGKPEPMFGLFPRSIQMHGLAALLADQFLTWREAAPKMTSEMHKQISGAYYLDALPNTMNRPSGHRSAKVVYELRRTEAGHELQPFVIMTRGAADVDWTTVQEFGVILPRQYIAPGMRLNLENPFQRQAPQFIVRVLNGYSDAVSAMKPHGVTPPVSKDLEGYLDGAGVKSPAAVAGAASDKDASPALNYRLQPKVAEMGNLGRHVFADVGPALEISFDNAVGEALPAGAEKRDRQTEGQKVATVEQEIVEHFQQDGFPSFALKGNAQNARGLALTVTGDGSGAFLVVQIGADKDYVVPIDFTGRRDIVVPTGEVARTTGRWGMRYRTKGAGYGVFRSVSIGFGRVPRDTHPKVLIENLRMLGEIPSLIKNPVIHAGSGALLIRGEVKSDQYLWYQGGDTVGVYDLNWCLQGNLPVVRQDYEVETGFSEFWIDGESSAPPPWLDVQFIAKSEVTKL